MDLLFLSQEPPECRGFLFWDWVVVVVFFFFLFFCNLINHLQISHTHTHRVLANRLIKELFGDIMMIISLDKKKSIAKFF